MCQKLVVAATVAALASHGCTLVGITVGGTRASSANAKREAQIRAGEEPEQEEASVASGVIGGAMTGLLIDTAALFALTYVAFATDSAWGGNN